MAVVLQATAHHGQNGDEDHGPLPRHRPITSEIQIPRCLAAPGKNTGHYPYHSNTLIPIDMFFVIIKMRCKLVNIIALKMAPVTPAHEFVNISIT